MTHPNEMVHWDEIRCQRGCESHPTRKVQIHLGGPTKYRDLTSIPPRFAMDFEIEVWDTDQTPVDGGPYCPARDAVSETIISHGVWEPRETVVILLALEALGAGAQLIDIGAQVGWFSKVAIAFRNVAAAWEADDDVATLLARNIGGDVHRERIGPDTSTLDVDRPVLPSVAKIDIEGAEADAIRALEPFIEDDALPFILMEVSPVFNDSYPDLVADLIDRGYEAYLMPPKANPPHQITSLANLVPEHVSRIGVREVVASWHQEDVLFVKGGVEAWA